MEVSCPLTSCISSSYPSELIFAREVIITNARSWPGSPLSVPSRTYQCLSLSTVPKTHRAVPGKPSQSSRVPDASKCYFSIVMKPTGQECATGSESQQLPFSRHNPFALQLRGWQKLRGSICSQILTSEFCFDIYCQSSKRFQVCHQSKPLSQPDCSHTLTD